MDQEVCGSEDICVATESAQLFKPLETPNKFGALDAVDPDQVQPKAQRYCGQNPRAFTARPRPRNRARAFEY